MSTEFNITVKPDYSEVVPYENPKFPVYVSVGQILNHSNMSVLCHWHDDIEIIKVIEGEMNYQINDKTILMKEGDCAIANSRTLHYGFHHECKSCKYICILIPPEIISANTYFKKHFVLPVIENKNVEFLSFTPDSDDFSELSSIISEMVSIKEASPIDCKIALMNRVYGLWSVIYKNCLKEIHHTTHSDPNLITQKTMISYIQEHFAESITLNEIAAAGNVGRSKCCILFKKYLNQSPVDFLNAYRLKRSCSMLTETDTKVTEIASLCGFNHASYFSKQFQQTYGCTPHEYRKRERK